MRLGFLFHVSLILLLVGVACSSVSSENDAGPTVQDQGGDNSDRLEQSPKSGKTADEGNNPAPTDVEWPLSFRVSRVLELDLREGKPEQEASIEERLQASTWEFFADGTFAYDTSRGVSTLYPIKGKYRLEERVLVFSGGRNHSYGPAGDASVNIEGEIGLNPDAPVASVLVKEKSTTVTNEYGGTMSTDKRSTYSSKLLLEPAR